MITKKFVLLALTTLSLGFVAACGNEGSNASAESSEKINESPIENWSEEKYNEVQNNFGEMTTIEDVNKEIVQMTTQKIESQKLKDWSYKDAGYEFTPAYPEELGSFEFPTDFAALTEDNLVYLKSFIEGLELSEENNEYYQKAIDEWLNDDFSNLIEVHKELFADSAKNTSEARTIESFDDYQLATEEQEKAFLEFYDLDNQY